MCRHSLFTSFRNLDKHLHQPIRRLIVRDDIRSLRLCAFRLLSHGYDVVATVVLLGYVFGLYSRWAMDVAVDQLIQDVPAETDPVAMVPQLRRVRRLVALSMRGKRVRAGRLVPGRPGGPKTISATRNPHMRYCGLVSWDKLLSSHRVWCRKAMSAAALPVPACSTPSAAKVVGVLSRRPKIPGFKTNFTPARFGRALILALRRRARRPFADTKADWDFLRKMSGPVEVQRLECWEYHMALKLRDDVAALEKELFVEAGTGRLQEYSLADLRCMLCLWRTSSQPASGLERGARVRISLRGQDKRKGARHKPRTGDRHKARRTDFVNSQPISSSGCTRP